jgi:hypothetical protein
LIAPAVALTSGTIVSATEAQYIRFASGVGDGCWCAVDGRSVRESPDADSRVAVRSTSVGVFTG